MDVSAIRTNVQPQTQTPAAGDQTAVRRELARAVQTVNSSQVLGAENEVVFVLDRISHRAIMRVVDRQTQEVVMQLPPEYVLHLAEDLRQNK